MRKIMGLPYLSWKSMKYNRRKTLFMILTVSLSVCLLTVVLQYLYSSRQRNIEIAALDTGPYHAVYTDLSEWQLRQLKESQEIQESTQLSGKDSMAGVQILLKSEINCKNTLRDIEIRYGLQEDQIHWNIPYLDAAEIELQTILQIYCILLGLLLSTAIVIYNIFNIYVLQDIRLFGTMRAAGFEDWQLKRFLRAEGIAAGCAGSLSGVLLGSLFSAFLIPVLGNTERNAGALRAETTFGIAAFSFLSGLVIVLLGIQKPLKTAAKMSVTEAMGYCPDYGLESRRKTGGQKNEIRIWDLCRINLMGNRKKNRWVVLSLVTTGVLFLIAASIIKSMDLENMIDYSIRGDYSLQLVEGEGRNKESTVSIGMDMLQEIEKQDGITGVHPIRYDRLVWDHTDAQAHMHLTEEFKELGIGYDNIDSIIYGYDDYFMEECLERLNDDTGIPLTEMRENNYAIVVENGVSDFEINDMVRLKNDSASSGVTEFRIMGILHENITNRGYSGAGNDFIIHQSQFEKLHMDSRIQRVAINVDKSVKEGVKTYLEQLSSSNWYLELESHDELMADYAEQRNALRTSSYSLLALLFSISVMNLLNTSLSNILSRKREVGMLEAIGLTKDQENMMFQTEGMVLVSISAATAVILGLPLGYAGFSLFSMSASYAVYRFPVMETLTLLLGFVAVQFAITKIAMRWLGRNSIIEKISYEDL